MEALAGVFGVVKQELAGSELVAVDVLVATHLLHELVGSEGVDEPEGT